MSGVLPNPALAQPAGTTRVRTEQSVDRQRRSVAAMQASVASQRQAVEQQPRAPRPSGFSGFSTAALTPVVNPTCGALEPGEIDALISKASQRTSVAPELIRSVMWQESRFRPCALSAKGAMGLMQLVPATAGDFGVGNAFDAEQNVLGGARLLRQLMDRYGGDLNLTLSAYNAGSGKVDAAGGVPMIPETIDYVSRILSHLAATGDHSGRDKAADTSLRLTGSDGGK